MGLFQYITKNLPPSKIASTPKTAPTQPHSKLFTHTRTSGSVKYILWTCFEHHIKCLKSLLQTAQTSSCLRKMPFLEISSRQDIIREMCLKTWKLYFLHHEHLKITLE